MDGIKLYEIDRNYVTYLSAYAPHLFMNKKIKQKDGSSTPPCKTVQRLCHT